jgi:hypothetical protein
MSHSHQKSIRVLTDVQMSDGTSVDSTRIDRALDESADRFNNLEEGDFSEQFTKSSFVFGMQPSPIVPLPVSDQSHSPGSNQPGWGNIATIETRADEYPICGQWLPWLPIVNQRYSSIAADISGPSYDLKFAPLDGYTPPDGFQNKWRVKGTNVLSRKDFGLVSNIGRSKLSDEMDREIPWFTTPWRDFWSGVTNFADYDQTVHEPAPQRNWQFAWSHSWEFNDPVIVDDMMLFVRTDKPWPDLDKYTGVSRAGWYDAPYEYQGDVRIGGSNHQFSTADIMFQMSVDNPFSTEERRYNDIECSFNSRDMSGYKVSEETNLQIQYSDMEPESPEFGHFAPSTGDGLQGRMIRLTGMNIPIRKGARLRLSIVLPWYKPDISNVAAQYNKSITNSRGLSPNRWSADTYLGNIMSKTLEPNPSGGTSLMGAPWDNCSINGCLTILEPLED